MTNVERVTLHRQRKKLGQRSVTTDDWRDVFGEAVGIGGVGCVAELGRERKLRASAASRSVLAAASAALVRSEIIVRSCSATAARMCSVNRVACGLSTATNSTPESMSAGCRQLGH
jgi:hypothetical protein